MKESRCQWSSGQNSVCTLVRCRAHLRSGISVLVPSQIENARKNLLRFLLFLLLAWPMGATAKNAAEIFHQAYFNNPQIYRPAQCGRNVFELAQVFASHNVELVNPEVLFFLSEYRYVTGIPMRTSLLPASSRLGYRAWDFHVVLTAEDPEQGKRQVYDLDWRSHPAELKDYLASMFPENKDQTRHEKITIRRLSLKDYREWIAAPSEVEILRRIGELRRDAHPDFPGESLKDYVKSLAGLNTASSSQCRGVF